jgi:hypothetical protein
MSIFATLRWLLVRAHELLTFENYDQMIPQSNEMPEMDACRQLFWVLYRYCPSLLAVGFSPATLGAVLATLSADCVEKLRFWRNP